MKIYLVGGAVRDKLLGIPHNEKDWVVVGSTPEEMLKQGFKPVGKDFPVFIHPRTGDEYALARTERKVGKGYKGFEFYADKNITLENDLKRRDLTINAIAETKEGKIIDPFHGQDDLKKKILRHVSLAFSEDPVRILRVARFAAKFGDFKIAPETMKLMQVIVASGEVNALVPERVWQEFSRALSEPHPENFIEVLRGCNALKIIFPEIDVLFGVPERTDYHPEADAGKHMLLTLKEAVKLSKDPATRFAALCHDFGKAKTPKDILPKHHGHEEEGAKLVKEFCKRIRAPREYQDLAVLVARFHGNCHKLSELTAQTILKMLKAIDPFRKPERFEKFLIACEADEKGRLGHENDLYPQAELFREIYEECDSIDIRKLIAKLSDNQTIEETIRLERLKVIKSLICNSASC